MQDLMMIARITLALVFLTSAGAKARLSPALVQAVQNYGLGLISPKLARVGAHLVPVFELLIGILLLSGLWLKLAASGALGILLIFTLAMTINLLQGRRFRCHCFGAASAEIGLGSLGRNLLLLIASLLLALFSPWIPSAIFPLHLDSTLLFHLNTLALVLASSSVYVLLLTIGEVDRLFRVPMTK